MKTATRQLKTFWWIPLLTGIVCLGLGIWELLVPREAIPVLAVVFGACLCLAGTLNIVLGGTTRGSSPVWGWSLALGIIEIIGGVWMLTLPMPEMVISFVLIVGFMVIVGAINACVESFTLAANNGWWVFWSVLLLLASIVLILIMVSNPLAYGVASWICLGCALITFGTYRIGLSFTLRRWTKNIDSDIDLLI